MFLEDLLHTAQEIIAPTRCAGCNAASRVLCDSCLDRISTYDRQKACPLCGVPYGQLVCTSCNDHQFAFDKVCVVGELDGPLARALVVYKDGFERRLGHVFAKMLAQRVAIATPNDFDVITWIPPTHSALMRRGFDHAGIIARRVGTIQDVPALQLASRLVSKDLRGLGKNERSKQAQNSFAPQQKILQQFLVSESVNILLVDDVITTGSTVNAYALMLRENASSGKTVSVSVAAIARAW